MTVNSAFRGLSDSGVPTDMFSITSGSTTYTYDLNKITITNNAFDRIIARNGGVIKVAGGSRIIANNNSFKKVGSFSEVLYLQMNPSFTTPQSTWSDYSQYLKIDYRPLLVSYLIDCVATDIIYLGIHFIG